MQVDCVNFPSKHSQLSIYKLYIYLGQVAIVNEKMFSVCLPG